MYNENDIINKLRELLERQPAAFQKGRALNGGVGKQITVNINGKKIKALSYNVISPNEVTVFYDSTHDRYIAWQQPNRVLRSDKLIYRRTKPTPVKRTFGKYLFKVFTRVVNSLLKVQGFGSEVEIENSDGYELVGLTNTGDGYVAIAKSAYTYLFDIDGEQFTVTLSPSSFIDNYVSYFYYKGGTTLHTLQTKTVDISQGNFDYTVTPSNIFGYNEQGSPYYLSGGGGTQLFFNYVLSSYITGIYYKNIWGLSGYWFVPDGYEGYVMQHTNIGQLGNPYFDYYQTSLNSYDYIRTAYDDDYSNTQTITLNLTIEGEFNSVMNQSLTHNVSLEHCKSYWLSWFGIKEMKGEYELQTNQTTYSQTATINEPIRSYRLNKDGLNIDDDFVITTINITVNRDYSKEYKKYLKIHQNYHDDPSNPNKDKSWVEPDESDVNSTDINIGGGNAGAYDYSSREFTTEDATLTSTVDILKTYDKQIPLTLTNTTQYKVYRKELSDSNCSYSLDSQSASSWAHYYYYAGGNYGSGGIVTPDFPPGAPQPFENKSHISTINRSIDTENITPSIILLADQLTIVKQWKFKSKEDTVITINTTGSVGNIYYPENGKTTTLTVTGEWLNYGSYVKQIEIFNGTTKYILDNTYKGFYLYANKEGLIIETLPTTLDLSCYCGFGLGDNTVSHTKQFTKYIVNDVDTNPRTYSGIEMSNNPVKYSDLTGIEIDFFVTNGGTTYKYSGVINRVNVTTSDTTYMGQTYTREYFDSVNITLTSFAEIGFFMFLNHNPDRYYISPKNDYNSILITYLEWDGCEQVNCYEEDGKMRIAIAKIPQQTDTTAYADIYEFDTVNKKFIRIGNDSSDLSTIDDTSNYISYHP